MQPYEVVNKETGEATAVTQLAFGTQADGVKFVEATLASTTETDETPIVVHFLNSTEGGAASLTHETYTLRPIEVKDTE